MKRKQKRKTPDPLEIVLACWVMGNMYLIPLTYASVDESVGNEPIDGPEVGTRCQE